MADKVGGGPNVRDLIRKFEDGAPDNPGESADKNKSGPESDAIEKGLVAKRVSEFETQTSPKPTKALKKDDFEGLRDKPDGFVRDIAARWSGKIKKKAPTAPTEGLNPPRLDGRTGRAAADELSRTSSLPTPLALNGPGGDIEIAPLLYPTMKGFSYSITRKPLDLNLDRGE